MQLEATQPLPALARPATGRRLELPTLGIALAVHGGFLALTLFFRELPLLLSVPAGSLLLAWYGSLQHETIHRHPTASRRCNELLGALPLALWLPYAIYRETHLRHHRHGGRYLTDAEHDPESYYVPAQSMSKAGRVRRWIYAANCTLVGRMTVGPAIAIATLWAGEFRRIVNGERRRVRIWVRHLLGVGLVLTWVVGVCHIALIVYCALVYSSVALTQLRSFAEHQASVDPRLRTRVVEAHPLWALIFLNNNLHIAHHVNPKLPWYELPQAWRRMRGAAQARGLIFEGGYREVTRKYLFRGFIRLDDDGG